MILIIDENKHRRDTLCETFYYIGILSVSADRECAFNAVSPVLKAVLISEPCELLDADGLIRGIRQGFPNLPIFVIADNPLTHSQQTLIARKFNSGVYAAELVEGIINYQTQNGLCPLGKYMLAGVDAGCDLGSVRYLSREVALTKTETMIVRYLIASYPTPRSAREILLGAYKPTKRPEEAAVRTQISLINRKFAKIKGERLITGTDKGYILLTPDVVANKI